MAELDLKRIQAELAASPLHSPYAWDLACAVVNDLFRLAGMAPVADARLNEWRGKPGPRTAEQMGMLAHLLAATSLRTATVAALADLRDPDPAAERSTVTGVLQAFFEAIEPLTAEMIRANQFRQEEFLRRWAQVWGLAMAGEDAAAAARRLEGLDYRKSLRELQEAEAARKGEAEARAKALREAAERDAAARGWRE
ncbi:MAG: hypothetical protein IT463_05000 [Planctomycetes bacterium]|nr:hypothetical protein [Planctomycetota bacterium]